MCPRSSDQFYLVNYYIKRVTTSWTHSTCLDSMVDRSSLSAPGNRALIVSQSSLNVREIIPSQLLVRKHPYFSFLTVEFYYIFYYVTVDGYAGLNLINEQSADSLTKFSECQYDIIPSKSLVLKVRTTNFLLPFPPKNVLYIIQCLCQH